MSHVLAATLIAAFSSVIGSVLTFIVGIRSIRRSVDASNGEPLGRVLDARVDRLEQRLDGMERSIGDVREWFAFRERRERPRSGCPPAWIDNRGSTVPLGGRGLSASPDVSEALRRRQVVAIRRFLQGVSAGAGRDTSSWGGRHGLGCSAWRRRLSKASPTTRRPTPWWLAVRPARRGRLRCGICERTCLRTTTLRARREVLGVGRSGRHRTHPLSHRQPSPMTPRSLPGGAFSELPTGKAQRRPALVPSPDAR